MIGLIMTIMEKRERVGVEHLGPKCLFPKSLRAFSTSQEAGT